MNAALSALVAVAATVLLAVAASAGPTLLTGAAAVCVLAVALGWGGLLRVPERRGTTAVVALTGLAGVAAAELGRTRERPLAAFASLIALGVLVAFAHELLRRDGRPRLVESLTGTFAGQVVAVLGAGWQLIPATALGVAGVTVAAVSAAATKGATAVAMPARLTGWVSFGVGSVAAVAAAYTLERSHLAAGVAVGVSVAVVVSALDRVLASQAPLPSVMALVSASVAPVTAAGTVAFAVAKLLTA